MPNADRRCHMRSNNKIVVCALRLHCLRRTVSSEFCIFMSFFLDKKSVMIPKNCIALLSEKRDEPTPPQCCKTIGIFNWSVYFNVFFVHWQVFRFNFFFLCRCSRRARALRNIVMARRVSAGGRAARTDKCEPTRITVQCTNSLILFHLFFAFESAGSIDQHNTFRLGISLYKGIELNRGAAFLLFSRSDYNLNFSLIYK